MTRTLNRMRDTLLSLSTDAVVVLLRRLAIVMLLFTVMRLIFFWFNRGFFPDVDAQRLFVMMLGGLRFDLVAVLYTNVLFIFMWVLPFRFRYERGYQRAAKYLFVVTNTIALGMNAVDVAYFRFTLRRTTKTVLQEFGNETDVPLMLAQLAWDYWPLVVLTSACAALLWLSYGSPLRPPVRFASPVAYRVFGVLMLGIATVLFVGGVRGGYEKGLRPITLSNAGQYVQRPVEMAVVLNTPFSVYKTLEVKVLEKVHYFDDGEELRSLFDPVHQPPDSVQFRPLNVVVIILESFGTEYIGALNGMDEGYTPFLDSLIGEGLTFTHSFANGKKSIDAMPSVLASIPSLVEPYVLTPYSGNEINSLASVLGERGYRSAFFHGAPNGSMGFQAFARIAGYGRYVGKTEYANDADFDGMWGIWDEEFLQFYARSMDTMRQPFHTAVFTVSSHHPYRVPERYEGVFPAGRLRIHQCIGYTDHALRQFFKTASRMPWFDSTLFVITADHTNVDTHHRRFQTSAGVFAVPVVFYLPDGSLRGRKDRLVQQNDIMPTVLRFLGHDRPFIAFGNDALDVEDGFVVNYNGFYQIFQGDHLLQFDGTRSTALFDFKRDTMLVRDLLSAHPEIARPMERRLKAFIQQYNARLIDNDLTVRDFNEAERVR